MSTISESIINEKDKILTAANWKSESEQPEFGDATYGAFVQIMTFRRAIAKRYLIELDEDRREVIRDSFEYCNHQIKKILGL